MFTQIDSIIAFVSVMLFASLIVTILTQIISALFSLRVKNLIWGLSRLLSKLEPRLKAEARKITEKILNDPLVSLAESKQRGTSKIVKRRLPSVIRREEFMDLLVQLAESDESKEFKEKTRAGLSALTRLDPAGIRTKIAELETWFDKMIDLISERFTRSAKAVSIGCALVVALAFQLDSIRLIGRITADAEVRAKIVAASDQLMKKADDVLNRKTIIDASVKKLNQKYPGLPAFNDTLATDQSVEAWLKKNAPKDVAEEKILADFSATKNAVIKETLPDLINQLEFLNGRLIDWGNMIFGEHYNWRFRWDKYAGILISWLLISLGAPFWFNALKKLTGLRSRLMQQEEKERGERQKQESRKADASI